MKIKKPSRQQLETLLSQLRQEIETARQEVIDSLVDWVEGNRKSYRKEDAWKCAVPHYNDALDMILAHLKNVK